MFVLQILCVQDDEYLASLQADQEKEMRAKAEAEARRLEEEAAREAALEEERRKEEESRRKLEEEQVDSSDLFFCPVVLLSCRQLVIIDNHVEWTIV